MAQAPNFTPGKYGAVFDYLDKQPTNVGANWQSSGEGATAPAQGDLSQLQQWQVSPEMSPYVSLDYTPGFETEGGPTQGQWKYNTQNLPGTKFGNDLSNVMLIRNQADYDKLKNQDLAYYDPNYGYITPHSNYDDGSWEDYIPTAIMAAASAGFGALAAPAIGAGLGIGAQGGQMVWSGYNAAKNYAMSRPDDNGRPTSQAQANPTTTGTDTMYNTPGLAQMYGKTRQTRDLAYPQGADPGYENPLPDYDQYDPQNIPGQGMYPNLDQYDPQNIPGQGIPPVDLPNPVTSTGQGGGAGATGGNWWDGIGNVVNGLTQGGLTSPLGYLAGIGMAKKQWDDADKWTDQSEEWAKQADPFGQYRPGYGEQLQRLNENPSEYLKTLPGYQAALEASSTAGIQRLTRGQQGMSNTINDITSAAGDVANKTYNTEATRLAGLAGANIDPAVAARLRQAGLEGSINSQNAALGSLMAPFGSQMQQNGSGTGSGTGTVGGTVNSVADLIKQVTGTGGAAAGAAVAALAKQYPQLSPAQLLGLLKMPDASVGGNFGNPGGVFTGHGDMPGDSYGPPSDMPSDPDADNPPIFDTDAPGTYPDYFDPNAFDVPMDPNAFDVPMDPSAYNVPEWLDGLFDLG